MSNTIDIRSLLPFQVRTKDQDNFTEGYDSLDAANTNAQFRNNRAAELGISDRYVVKENPTFSQQVLNEARQAAGIKINSTK